jgi:hypothetical protein
MSLYKIAPVTAFIQTVVVSQSFLEQITMQLNDAR